MSKNYKIATPTKKELTEKGFTNRLKIEENVTIEQLLEYGFTNNNESTLYLMRMVGRDISFNLTLDIKSLKIISIDVLDEDFLQPYDYQSMLMHNDQHPYARKVLDGVDKILEKLQVDRIINGYQRGMYI